MDASNLLSGLIGTVIGAALAAAGGAWSVRRENRRIAREGAYRRVVEAALRIKDEAGFLRDGPPGPTADMLYAAEVDMAFFGGKEVHDLYAEALRKRVQFNTAKANADQQRDPSTATAVALRDRDARGDELRALCDDIVSHCRKDLGLKDQ